jgi:uncharacterized protein
MAQIRSQTKTIINKYRLELKRCGVDVQSIFLYGSYAHGSNHEGSDIDLIVVSQDFKSMNLIERLEKLGVASAHIMEPIQAYGFTSSELDNPNLDSFWSNILKNEAVLA